MKIEYATLSVAGAEARREEFEKRSGVSRPAIRVHLLDMTAERKRYLFEELGVEEDDRLDAFVFDVERVLHMFLHHKNAMKRDRGLDPFTSAAAKKTYAAIHRHLSEAHALLTTLDDRSLDLLTPDEADLDIETFCEDSNMVAETAGGISDAVMPARGRPARDDLFEALIDLGALFEQATGKTPGYSSRPEKKPGAAGHEVHGPFVRFVHRVLSIVDANGIRIEPSPASTIDNAIRRYIDERNRRARRRAASVKKTRA